MVIPVFALRTSGSSPHGMLKTASGVRPSRPRRLSQHNVDFVDQSVRSQPKASLPSRVDRHFWLSQTIQFSSCGYSVQFLPASCVILWYAKTWSHAQVSDRVFRLHSGHNHLTCHLLTEFGTSQSELSPCQTASCVILWYAKTWSHAQVSDCVFRLHSGHNRLTCHLLTEFGTGQSELSPCQTGSVMHRTPATGMSAPHNNCRSEFCLVETAVARKVFSGWDDLQCMAAFVQKIKVSIWMTQMKKRNCTRELISTRKTLHKCNNKNLSCLW